MLDTSLWVHAFAVGLLPLILRRYALRYTAEVDAELAERFASSREFRRLAAEGALERVAPGRDRLGLFGAGERSALNVALEHRGWTLLLDDHRPYIAAVRLGLRTLCSPLLVIKLLGDGAINRAEALHFLDGLSALGTVQQELVALGYSLLPGPVAG